MSKFYVFCLLLLFLNLSSSYCQEDGPIYITILGIPDFKDKDNQKMKCIAKNKVPSQIYFSTESLKIETTGSITGGSLITGIEGGKLVNKRTSSSIDMSCSLSTSFGTAVNCIKLFSNEEKLEPGTYFFETTETLSGSPRQCALKPYAGQDSITVINEFPEKNNFERTINWGNEDNNYLEFTFKEKILAPPSFRIEGDWIKKNYDCFVDFKDDKKLICKIERGNFTPKTEGKKYKIMFYNYCGENDINGTIISKGDEIRMFTSGGSDGVVTVIFLVLFIAFLVGSIFVGKFIYKKLLDKNTASITTEENKQNLV